MKNTFKGITVVALGLMLSACVVQDEDDFLFTSDGTNSIKIDGYDVFSGDQDGDGLDEIILRAKQVELLIGSEFRAPMTYKYDHIVFEMQNDGSYELRLLPPDTDLGDLGEPTHVPIFANFNNDDKTDLLLQGITDKYPTIIIYGGAESTPFINQYITEEEFGVSPSSNYTDLHIEDLNGDGYDDIIFKQDSNIVALAYGSADEPVALSSDSLVGKSSDGVGTIGGQLDVGPDGMAVYQVPISVPVSHVGLAPNLSLSITGIGANGIAGSGGHLSGLSTIERCPQTKLDDKIYGAVSFSSSDKLCLNGSRLNLITAELSYGAANTEYRTQPETHTKIIAHGKSGGKEGPLNTSFPSHFSVISKDGTIAWYGDSEDSLIEAEGRADVLTWALTRVEDPHGNYIDYIYEENELTGEYFIDSIRYTGNRLTNLLPYATVKFNYESRNDIDSYFVSGSKVERTKRFRVYPYTERGSLGWHHYIKS